MRVISRDPHPSVVKEKICTNCGVTLEYVPADIQTKIVSDYTGSKDSYSYITCPECKQDLSVIRY